MARDRRDLGARKQVRIDLDQPGYLIPAPDAPWIECHVLDISEDGTRLEVGALAVPKLFGLSLTSGGEVLRVCKLVWRRGELIGARFVTAKELRQSVCPQLDPPRKLRRPAPKHDAMLEDSAVTAIRAWSSSARGRSGAGPVASPAN